MSVCFSDHDLEAFVGQGASEERMSGWKAHLSSCDSCALRLGRLQAGSSGQSAQEEVGHGSRDPDATITVKLPGKPNLDVKADQLPADAIPGYRILKELHRGGQGVVYQAVQLSTKRKVALKVMLEGPFAGPESKRRFEREIALVGSLRHPNIVPIFDSGVAQGRFFYAMEYIRGEPLSRYVQSRKLSVDDTLKLFKKVCDAVDYAHQKGVIHRDLKPSNILVDNRGDPYVLDFGLAKIGGAEAEGDAASMVVSVTGQVIGTLAYMSPEQASGRPDEVDMRSDVYALGVILFELLTEQYPYDVSGQMADTLRTIQEVEPRRPSTIRRQVNDEVETIVLKALSKEKPRRYNTAGALGEDIERFLADEPIEAKRDSGWYVLKKNLRRYKAPVTIAAAFILLITLGLAASLTFWRQAVDDRAVANTNATIAREARDDAVAAALRADQEAQRNRQLLYMSDMDSALQAWEEANVARVHDLLKRHTPAPAEEDLRGFEWYYLWRLYERTLNTPKLEHGASIRSVAYSQGRKLLATGGDDYTVKVWDALSHKLLHTFEGHTDDVGVVAFSPRGDLLASGSQDGTIILWNVETGRRIGILPHTAFALAFTSDGKTLASASWHNEIRLWDVENRKLRLPLKAHERQTTSLAFSADDSILASAGLDGQVRLWRRETGKLIKTIPAHAEGVDAVAFSPVSGRLASGGRDATARLWDVETGDKVAEFKHRVGSVRALMFSPDGKTLATGSDDNTVRLWDVKTREELDTFKGHSAGVWSVAYVLDGRALASASDDGTTRLWDLTLRKEPDRLEGHMAMVRDVAFSPDGRTLASGSFDNTVRLWDLAAGSTVHVHEKYTQSVICVAFSPVHAVLASASGKVLSLWDMDNHEEYYSIPHDFSVRSIAFSPDGTLIATGTSAIAGVGGVIRLFEARTGQLRRTFKGHTDWVRSLAFSPDGKTLASACAGDRTLRLWDVETGNTLHTLRKHTGWVTSVAFRPPDGKTLASGSTDTTIKIWDAASGHLIRSLSGHAGQVLAVAFSPDGKTLASGSADRTIKLWDAQTGEERATLKGHTKTIWSVAFSPDGTILASGSEDRTIRLWRRATAEEVRKAGW